MTSLVVISPWSAEVQSWKAVGISQIWNNVVSLHLAFLHDTPADNLTALEATGLYDALCVQKQIRLCIMLMHRNTIKISFHSTLFCHSASADFINEQNCDVTPYSTNFYSQSGYIYQIEIICLSLKIKILIYSQKKYI